MFFGNLFVYYQFQGKTHIDHDTRQLIFGVLISVAVIGVVFLSILRKTQDQHQQISTGDSIDKQGTIESDDDSILGAFKNAIRLFFTKDMLLLSLTFLYTGNFIFKKI